MRSKLTSVTAAAPLGLRERKKQQTRSLLHRAALDLVLEHGPDDVTVDQIAAKAQVSTRTFFNYYATKDAAIAGVTPEFADLVVADFTAAARDAGVLTALERALARRVSGLASDGALRRQRAEVFQRWPQLVPALSGPLTGMERALREAVAAHLGVDGRVDPRPARYVLCATAVLRSALSTPGADLTVSVAEGFEALRAGLPDLAGAAHESTDTRP